MFLTRFSLEPFLLNGMAPLNKRRESLEAEKSEFIADVPFEDRSKLAPLLKFVNREKSINALLKHAADQYRMYLRGFGEKEAQFAACAGGPGLGKVKNNVCCVLSSSLLLSLLQTTFCRKAFIRAIDGSDADKVIMWEGVEKKFQIGQDPDSVEDNQFQTVVKDCVESGRQYRLSFGSDPLEKFETSDPSKSLALRLMRLAGLEVKWDQLPEGRIILPQVISYLTDSTKEALLVVNLDETNKLMETKLGVAYLAYVMSAIRCCNRDKRIGFIYLTLSGTNVQALVDSIHSETGVPPEEIALPLLEVRHMQEVLLDLQERKQSVRSLGQQLDFVLEVLGGVPRYLEMLAFVLGQQGTAFTHAKYCEALCSSEHDASLLMEKVKSLIVIQYSRRFAEMIAGIPCDALMAISLFRWPVERDKIIAGTSVRELETRGIVFLQYLSAEKLALQMPLLLMLFAAAATGGEVGMLLRHFDVMLSSDENERNSLAAISLKCRGLTELGVRISLGDLLPLHQGLFPQLDASWAGRELLCDSYALFEAEKRITTKNWPTAVAKLQEQGVFVVNCREAPFADMIIVPKGGTFAIFLQEKQRERAKEKLLDGKTIPTVKIESVQEEHEKCKVDTPHLFVLITDERFDAYDQLKANEIVLPYDQHSAMMGPLLALLRRFNHSNRRKIAV
jgi:hypothetical protein